MSDSSTDNQINIQKVAREVAVGQEVARGQGCGQEVVRGPGS